MRNAMRIVLFLCVLSVSFSVVNGNVQALSPTDLALTDDPFGQQATLEGWKKEAENYKQKKQDEEKRRAEETAAQAQRVEESKQAVHTVVADETLSSIARQYASTWRRIFDKNPGLSNPDVLSVGAVLTIPTAEEQLAERPVPTATPVITVARVQNMSPSQTNRHSGGIDGNTYAPGYCTWYAKNRRPDLPNRLGNASAWVASAAARGLATGSAPRAGAIGQQGNHVVYVESVHDNGTVTVSEMNYRGLFTISSRTVSANNFHYIY